MAESGSVDGFGDNRVEAQGEVAVAVLALDSLDLPHAADHIAAALHSDPTLPEAHEMLSRLVVAAGGADAALELYSMDRPYIGAMAARAHLLAATGRWDAAVSLLAQIVAVDPRLPWAHVPWMERTDLAAALSAETVLHAIIALNRELPEPVPVDDQRVLAPLYELLCAGVEHHADDARLLAIGSGLARRFAAFDRAETWALQAHRMEPGQITSVMLGQVYRASERPEAAIAVWTEQLHRDPSDLHLHTDLAELYAQIDHPELGIPWLERVLALDPVHEKAAPALHGLRYRIDGDARHLVALADHLREYPEHHYAGDVLAEHCGGAPWLGYVDVATESLVNLLRQVLDEVPDCRELDLEATVSMIEPPSAIMTVRSVLPRATIAVSAVGDPDPRLGSQTWAPVGAVVWQYPGNGTSAVAAVPAPAPAPAEKVRQTARLRWPHLPAVYDFAVVLADVPLPDLIGTLVHPPAPRDDEEGRALTARYPDLWVQAVQVFACLGIAHHRVVEPWPESTRRTVLLDLLNGPEDWVCEAAAVALLAVAWTQPDTRSDIGLALCQRMMDLLEAYRSRPVTIAATFCSLILACPWLDGAFLDLARDMLAVFDAPD
ncbi:tetratricopeptide repeat protein [Nocardia crassostreae]|uniref:tetratricopeptide repeat protein n=1 Tax=Nocardia crassostreae TaxID=53428 RepID=UPI000829BC45|nr:tetratricopeptide repeat protein [Nocardia crassostreae]